MRPGARARVRACSAARALGRGVGGVLGVGGRGPGDGRSGRRRGLRGTVDEEVSPLALVLRYGREQRAQVDVFGRDPGTARPAGRRADVRVSRRRRRVGRRPAAEGLRGCRVRGRSREARVACPSPLAIGHAVGARLLGLTVDVVDARLGVRFVGVVLGEDRLPVRSSR